MEADHNDKGVEVPREEQPQNFPAEQEEEYADCWRLGCLMDSAGATNKTGVNQAKDTRHSHMTLQAKL